MEATRDDSEARGQQAAPPAPPEAPPPPGPPAAAADPSEHRAAPVLPKSPRVAAFLACFPGLGNIYNGLYLRGVTFFVLFVALFRMADRGSEEIWGPSAAFLWFFNVLDSHRQAKLINLGFTTDLGLLDRPRPAGLGQGSLLAGVVIFLVGLGALLDIHLGVDIDWILDFWPVGLMALGAWFIWSALRSRQEPEAQPEEDLPLGPSEI